MTEQGSSLYNRHRPTTFADLVGQSHVERALGNALRASRPAQDARTEKWSECGVPVAYAER